MSGAIIIRLDGLERFQRRLDAVSRPGRQELMDVLAVTVESQTRKRLSEDKEAPSGKAWPAWSPGYAKTRKDGQSLLEAEGGLIDSITSEATPDSALIGSNLRYAAIHNFGGTPDMPRGPAGVPAREYLGLSEGDAQELTEIVEGWLMAELGVA